MFPGVVASSYPKTIGPTEFSHFGPPDGGTRRSYNGSFDQYVDTPGWTWSAGGPLSALISAGYTLSMAVRATDLEANSGTTHQYRLFSIGGTTQPSNLWTRFTGGVTPSPDVTGAYTAPSSQTVSGSVVFHDGTDHSGETDHQGLIYLYYQYTRA